MSLDPRKPDGFERLEAAACASIEEAKADSASLRTASEAAVVRWEYATGEYYSPHPLGCEFVSNAAPGLLTNDPDSPYAFGFDAQGRLRVTSIRVAESGVRVGYTRYEENLAVTVYCEDDRHRQRCRPYGALVVWRSPDTPAVLVVRGHGQYREVIDISQPHGARVRAASSSWKNFGLEVEYEVVLDLRGRATRVSTSHGAVVYERPRKKLEPLLRSLRADLPREIERAMSRAGRSTSKLRLVLSYGDSEELFPPLLHLLEMADIAETQLPDALEEPSTYEAPLYAEAPPRWLSEVLAWLSDSGARSRILRTMEAAVGAMNESRVSNGLPEITLWRRD